MQAYSRPPSQTEEAVPASILRLPHRKAKTQERAATFCAQLLNAVRASATREAFKACRSAVCLQPLAAVGGEGLPCC